MFLIRDRLKLPVALALITIFTLHLLWYPIYGEHFVRLGDQRAAHALRQWHFWNPVFFVGLLAGWAILYAFLRRNGDRTRIMPIVTAVTLALAIIVLELLLIAGYAYIRYSLFHAKT